MDIIEWLVEEKGVEVTTRAVENAARGGYRGFTDCTRTQ